MIKFLKATIAILIIVLPKTMLSQSGFLDLSFGKGGKVITSVGVLDNQAATVLSQEDGKVIMTGLSYTNNGTALTLLRYKLDGNLDSAFGKNGISITEFQQSFFNAKAAALQKNGEIICVGQINIGVGDSEYLIIAKYLPNGIIDSSFQKIGYALYKYSDTTRVTSIAIENDQSILVGGAVQHSNSFTQFYVAHFFNNGDIDSSFGINGRQVTSFDNRAYAYSMTLQPDGRIILAGNGSKGLGLIRYKANGSLDSTFGDNGKVDQILGNMGADARSIALQSDGKIVVCGFIGGFGVARFKQNGMLDSTFGTNGYSQIIFGSNYESTANSILVQPNQQIIVSGIDNEGLNQNFAIAKFNSNGLLDSSFGINGKNTTDFGHNYDYSYSSCLQPDGKIVLSGTTDSSNGLYRFALARYNNDDVLPITLFNFTASNEKGKILLNWQTASELNNAYFVVERSSNPNNGFINIGNVANKNSAQGAKYIYEDVHPFIGKNYYRLKQVDKDNSFTYSKTVLADVLSSSVKVYPNPVKDILNIDITDDLKNTTLSIISASGNVIKQLFLSELNNTLNIKEFPAGVYYVVIHKNEKLINQKFIKQ